VSLLYHGSGKSGPVKLRHAAEEKRKRFSLRKDAVLKGADILLGSTPTIPSHLRAESVEAGAKDQEEKKKALLR